MIDNGEILGDLQDNISATLTREHYLLSNLKAYDDVELIQYLTNSFRELTLGM